MAFSLPDLPYPHDALAPKGMSRETLEFHHDLHHKAYVDNGNKLIAGTEWEDKSLEEIIAGTYQAGAVAQNGIFNNISQLWNHNQFWEMMTPGESRMPGEVERAMHEPPEDTRAYFRGQCLARYASEVVAASWDSVIFDVGRESLVRVPMMEPERGTKKHVGALFDKCDTAKDLLEVITSR